MHAGKEKVGLLFRIRRSMQTERRNDHEAVQSQSGRTEQIPLQPSLPLAGQGDVSRALDRQQARDLHFSFWPEARTKRKTRRGNSPTMFVAMIGIARIKLWCGQTELNFAFSFF
jgi:hypothetical protein